MQEKISVFAYFRHPFPSREGFSAYRMPGPSLHVPLIAGSAGLGFLLCWPHPVLRPLILIWIVAGVYLGREFTIFCHYALPLALLAWIAFFLLVAFVQPVTKFGRTHLFLPALLSIALGGLQTWVAYTFTRQANAELARANEKASEKKSRQNG